LNEIQVLEFYRKELMHEFNLLSHRVSWFITCQSFLIAAFTLCATTPAQKAHTWLSEYIIPFLGVSISCLAMPGIMFAAKMTGTWLDKQRQYFINCKDLDPLKCERDEIPKAKWDTMHWLSHYLP